MIPKVTNNLNVLLKQKAALYIRVSTVYQIDKDSLKVQERELTNYAKYILGIEDYIIFRDAGYSAKNTDRPDYQLMMRKLRTGEFSHLIVWKIDRISRNLLDFAEMYTELKNLGVTFISKNEQFGTSTAVGEAMLKITEWIIVEDHHEGIIDKKQFDRCQELLKQNVIGSADRSTYNRKNVHVLAGLLFCDFCGENMAAQTGKRLRKQGNVLASRYSCYNRRLGLCKNKFTSDSVIGPFILNYIANMYRTQKTFGKTTSIEPLEKKLLRGEAFQSAEHVEAHDLQALFNALRSDKFGASPVLYDPHVQQGASEPSQYEMLVNEKLKEETALQRLHSLFMYSESDISEKEYFEKKHVIDKRLAAAQKALDDYEAKQQNEGLSSDEFMALASNFILANNIASDRYLDYFKLLRTIEPMELKLFLSSVISKCFIRDGKVASIMFKNGEEHHFLYTNEGSGVKDE